MTAQVFDRLANCCGLPGLLTLSPDDGSVLAARAPASA
jgi:hypothetical protein